MKYKELQDGLNETEQRIAKLFIGYYREQQSALDGQLTVENKAIAFFTTMFREVDSPVSVVKVAYGAQVAIFIQAHEKEWWRCPVLPISPILLHGVVEMLRGQYSVAQFTELKDWIARRVAHGTELWDRLITRYTNDGLFPVPIRSPGEQVLDAAILLCSPPASS